MKQRFIALPALLMFCCPASATPATEPNFWRCLTFDYLHAGDKLPPDFEAGRWKRNRWYVSSLPPHEILVSDRIATPNQLGLVTAPALIFSPIKPETRFFAAEIWYGTPFPKRGEATAYDGAGVAKSVKLTATPHMSLLYTKLEFEASGMGIRKLKIDGKNIIVAKVCFLGRFKTLR